MPQAQPQIQLIFSALPQGWRGTPQDFLDQIRALASITLPAGFLGGYIQENQPPNNSGLWFKPSTGVLSYWNPATNSWTSQPLGTEVGEIKWFAFSAVDLSRYVPCDGSAVPRIAPYDNLYAKLGVKWGAGDGSTTFNVPDLRGRAAIGAGTGVIPAVGSAAAGVLTLRTLGDVIGEETHALTPAEVPALTLNGNKGNTADVNATGYGAANGAPHNNIQPSLVLVPAIRYA
jgi:microcystin-dependent protein